MSNTLRDFYAWLSDHFEADGGAIAPEAVKAELEQNGFGDVTAYDVREAVGLMYDEGDVFNNDQSSVLEAYTGGNTVDQSFNASNFGNVNAGGGGAVTTSGAAGSSAPSGGPTTQTGTPVAQQEPMKATSAPQPPPMDPKDGYTDLDAAVEQIVYVTNITNNTTNNTTTINDNDTFEDNDTIVDNSIDQTILANGDVTQDFDTVTQGDGSIANTGNVQDSNFVTGDNDGVIADDISDTNIVDGDNSGLLADDVTGSAVVGDGNETNTFIGSDNNAVGDGATALEDSDGNAIGDGATAVNVNGDNNGVIETGDGDVQAVTGNAGAVGFGDGDVNAITNSTVGQASFGDGSGDQTAVDIDDSNINESAFQTGDGNSAAVTTDDSITSDNDIVNDQDTINVVENNTQAINESIVVSGDDTGIDGGPAAVDLGGEEDALVEGV